MKVFSTYLLFAFLCHFSVIANAQEPPIDTFILVQEFPEPLNLDDIRKRMIVPKEVIEAGIDGKIVFRILVDSAGNYVKHTVVKDVPFLRESIEKHLSDLKFAPAIKDGKPVSFWLNIPFQVCIMRD